MLELAAPRPLEQFEDLGTRCISPHDAECTLHDVTSPDHVRYCTQCNVFSVDHVWSCTHCHVCQLRVQSGSESPVNFIPLRRTIRQSIPSVFRATVVSSADTVLAPWTCDCERRTLSPYSSSFPLSVVFSPVTYFSSTAGTLLSAGRLQPPTSPSVQLVGTPPLTLLVSPGPLPPPHTFTIPSFPLLQPILSTSTATYSTAATTTTTTTSLPSCATLSSLSTLSSSKSTSRSSENLWFRRDWKDNNSCEVTFHGGKLPARDGGVTPGSSSPPKLSRESRSTLRRGTGSKLSEVLVRLAVVALLALMTATAAAYQLKPTTTLSRVTLAGLTAKLPCELPLPADRPTLILWYKDQATKPFYSYDARETATGQHKVHEDSQLGKRSRFTLETLSQNFRTRLGFLEVEDVTLADAGNYTCRVDFMTSQTLMSLLQLTVHEEIRGLEIFDAYEAMIGKVVGPYEQSSRVVLSCRAYGGYPPPVVKWVSGDGEVLERSWSRQEGGGIAPHHHRTSSSSSSGEGRGSGGQQQQQQPVSVVSATIQLPPLIREDNGRHLECVASNTNLTHDRSRVVTINMHLPPLEVKMEGLEEPLRAGVEAPLVCRATGSRPPATLTWQINGSTGLTSLPAQSSLDQNTTIRRGRLLPTPDDNGQSVTCTATNPKVPDYMVATTHTLKVHFAPEVRVQLAPALDPTNIKEGDDVYFECQIKANPPESRVVWLHQGRRLHTNKEKGVLAQGRNLVLQKVSRQARGHYQCTVTNSIDTVTSAPTPLDVMFVPECREPRNVTVSVTGTEEVTLNCVVESNPEEVSFLWKVNSSRGVKEMASSSYRSHGRTSTLVYRPHEHAHTQDQYGVVFCLGSNRLGSQKIPCMFVISPAGPPEEPVSCSLVNQSATSLAVACVPGHDGGLTQHFVTTIKDAATQEVVANVSSDTPTFSVGGLAPGRDYLLLVTAANHKGKSSPYVIQGFALKVAENKINNSSSTESSPLLAVFVGVVSGFAFIITVLAVATRSRCQRRRGRPDAAADNNKLGGEDEGPSPLPLTKTSLDEAEDGDDELSTPGSRGGPLEPQELTTQGGGSPGSGGSSSRTYVPPAGRHQPQPLHSVDLPHITANNHKYYKIKIDCTRLKNESFV